MILLIVERGVGHMETLPPSVRPTTEHVDAHQNTDEIRRISFNLRCTRFSLLLEVNLCTSCSQRNTCFSGFCLQLEAFNRNTPLSCQAPVVRTRTYRRYVALFNDELITFQGFLSRRNRE